MAPRLKVFVTSDGLTDYVVAASSRPKALAAWGSHQDLFKTGLAHETEDPDLVEAAVATPGTVLRRPAGSRKALAAIKAAPKPRRTGPTKAQLARVERLEARFEALEREHDAALARLEAQRAKLNADYEAARDETREALKAAREAVSAAS